MWRCLAVACTSLALGLALSGEPAWGQGVQGVAGGAGGAGGAAGAAGGTAGAAGAAGAAGGAAGGILIDPQGVVRPHFRNDGSGTLDKKRRAEMAGRALPADLNAVSALRKVSLNRLEAECETFARDKQHVTGEMQYLAGLQRIDYVFIYPETKDLVIAGPAEGFLLDGMGRAIGTSSNRPALRLDDLIVALRAVERAGVLGCSIDPVPDNLARLKAFVAQNSSTTTPDVARRRYEEMARILGLQDVRIFGVPAESHFAQVLVEADVRMKRLSIGADPSPVPGLKSHLAMIGPGTNTMQRWWFTPLYNAFTRTEDGLAFQIAGPRLQLMAQEEMVGDAGQRSDAAISAVSVDRYAKQFTQKFPELANTVSAFADLQNIVDLAVLAALIKKERLADPVQWKMSLFLDAERAGIARFPVPRRVETIVQYKKSGRGLFIGLIGGGVTIHPLQVVTGTAFEADAGGHLKATLDRNRRAEDSEKHPWWWD